MPEVRVNITGYRQLSEQEQATIRAIKELENAVGTAFHECIAKLPEADGRWLAMARTDLQTGFMKWVRGIAQPQSEL